MNCNLTDKERDNGHRCRSFNCRSCADHGISTNDATLINIHMENMMLKKELEEKHKEIDTNKCIGNDREMYRNEVDRLKKEMKETQKLLDEALKLIDEMLEVIMFYAKAEHWTGYHRNVDTIMGDTEPAKALSDNFDIFIGGKKAREYLQKMESEI